MKTSEIVGLLSVVVVALTLGGVESSHKDFTLVSGGVVCAGIIIAILCFAVPDIRAAKKQKAQEKEDEEMRLHVRDNY